MPKKPKKAKASPTSGKPKGNTTGKPPRGIHAIDTVTTLKDLRKATQHTQDDLAIAMGVGQGAVSRIEKRDDMLVSTLQQYVEGLGGTFRILATFPDRPPLIVERLGKKATTPPRSSDRNTADARNHANA